MQTEPHLKQPRVILLEAVSTGNQALSSKQSLPEQDERLRELAQRFHWNIVDVILVPGHSRAYYTYREFAEDALSEGIPAPMRMFEHWQKRDFDVFACSSGDRFGREQSIFAEVVGRTIDAGAIVYTLRDGEINKANRRMFVSMGGYQASTEIDELKRRYNFGMNRRAADGKPLSSRVVFTHRVVRDDKGKAVTMMVRDEMRPLIADIAALLLERVAWSALEHELYQRCGHVADNGKPFPRNAIYHLLHSATFWGNSARHAPPKSRGAWVFDASAPKPEGALMHYGTHEAGYTGEVAEEVKAELRRRLTLRGSARPDSDYALSAMFACAECGYKMAWTYSNRRWRGARCNTAYGLRSYTEAGCSQRQHMPEQYALTYMRQLVSLIVTSGDIQQALAALSEPEPVDETPELERQLTRLEDEGRALIQKQLRAPASVSALYDEQIDVLGKRMEALQARLDMARHKRPSASDRASQQQAVIDMRALGDAFWNRPAGEINQVLRRVFLNRVFLVRDGAICGLKTLE